MSALHTITDELEQIRARLERAGIGDAAVDAELIIGHVLDLSRGAVQSAAILGTRLTPEQQELIAGLADQRAQRIPLQHLTGRAPFRGIELRVGPGVFTPRPETEMVAQFAIDELQADASLEPIAIDLCTGSGAIALAIANEVDRARVWAVERDAAAHAWAERNIAALGQDRVTLLRGDVRDLSPSTGIMPVSADACSSSSSAQSQDPAPSALAAELAGRVSVVVTNPPYVPSGAIPRDPEVRDHDPEAALYSGEDGLELIRAISLIARPLLRPGGLLVIEHAETQGEAVRRILTRGGWNAAATHRDLTHRDRATTARR